MPKHSSPIFYFFFNYYSAVASDWELLFSQQILNVLPEAAWLGPLMLLGEFGGREKDGYSGFVCA